VIACTTKPTMSAAATMVAARCMFATRPARFIALPFDSRTGRIRDDVWARWLAWDPARLVGRYESALRSLRLLFIDCGTRDEWNLHFGARVLAEELKSRGIPHRHEEFDDGHMQITYRYDVSLAALSQALAD